MSKGYSYRVRQAESQGRFDAVVDLKAGSPPNPDPQRRGFRPGGECSVYQFYKQAYLTRYEAGPTSEPEEG